MTIVAALAPALIVVAGLGVAVWLMVRGRSRGVKLLAIPLVLALVQWIVVPVIGAALATVPVRHPVPAAAGIGVAGARDVVFRASDGTRLAGWWVPGRTGAAVIVAHGSHGDRGDTLPYLRMLHDAGYGVLAYDARGHGRSDGTTNALGWDGAADVAGAVAYLRGDPGVDAGGIAMLGLSMGAEAALRAAADGVPLRAVVADGAGASTSGDRALVRTGALAPIAASTDWLTMRLVEGIGGADEPAPLVDVAHRIRVPVLLIASNRGGERTIDDALRRGIGRRAQLWYVGDAGHTQALERHPRRYTDRIGAFLDAAIGAPPRRPAATRAT